MIVKPRFEIRTKTIKRKQKYIYHLDDIDLSKSDGPPRLKHRFTKERKLDQADSENEEQSAVIKPEEADDDEAGEEEEEEGEIWLDSLSHAEIAALSISQLVREGKASHIYKLITQNYIIFTLF